MMTTAIDSIVEVLFRSAVGDPRPTTPMPLPIDVDLDAALVLTTPLEPPELPVMSQLVERARAALCSTEHDSSGQPLPDLALMVEAAVRRQLNRYQQPQPCKPDRLYVLEFQGHHRQHLKIGHTRNLEARLAHHTRNARPYGFAMLQGWVSPGLANAQPLEQELFNIAGLLHNPVHAQERFHNMAFQKGLTIARAVFEFNTDWPTPTTKHPPHILVTPES